ncbi:MAG: hypothetical protein ACOX5W_11935 [Bacillota bacterium]
MEAPRIYKRIANLAKGHINGVISGIKDKGKNQKITKADFMFFSNPICRVLVNNCWYDRFCDPIRQELDKRGYYSLYMEMLHDYRIPRYNSGTFIQSKLDHFKIESRLLINDTSVSKWEGFIGLTEELANDWSIKISFKQVIRSIRYVDRLSNWYSDIIKKARIKACFMICYYSLEGMALSLACRKCGIPSIDIQHGVQGSGHRAYSSWTKVPRNGYELLPTFFWCWSDYEVDIISEWGKKAVDQHKAIVAGNPWLDKYQQLAKSGVYRVESKELDMLIHNKRRILLICLSGIPTFGVGLDDFLLDTMKNSDPSFLWLVRIHPSELSYQESICAQLKERGISNFDVELSSKLPLPLILERTNIHLTHWSTTALEAAAYNIPTIFLDKKGPEFFREQISFNLLYFANDSESLHSAIDNAKCVNKTCGKSNNSLKDSVSLLLNTIKKN